MEKILMVMEVMEVMEVMAGVEVAVTNGTVNVL